MSVSSLDELQGLTGAKRATRRYVQATSGIHAVLLYGIRGSGKMQLARFMAKSWLSNNDFEAQVAMSFENGRNPDFLLVQPMGPSRIIRDLQMTPAPNPPPEFKGPTVLEFLRTPPLVSTHKVVLIEDADRMNDSAANVLLKSLEEPHAYTKFILTTEAVASLPATIRSRCSAVACELPASESVDPLWLLAEGAPGRFQELMKHESVYRGIWQFAGSLRRRSLSESLQVAETARELCDSLQKLTEQNARSAQSETLELLAIAIRHQFPDWHAARKAIIEAHRRIIGNGNASLILDAMAMGLLA